MGFGDGGQNPSGPSGLETEGRREGPGVKTHTVQGCSWGCLLPKHKNLEQEADEYI